MYLLLSDPGDSLCERVGTALVQRGCEVRIIDDIMRGPARFAWRLEGLRSESRIAFDDGSTFSDKDIEGVVVRRSGRITHDFWDAEDVPYLDEEAHAALFSWLWSLDCPVVNRYPPNCWFFPSAPILFWQKTLESCGLRTLDFLLTNVREERLDPNCGPMSTGMPLTSAARQFLNPRDLMDENNISLRNLPLLMAEPDQELHRVCVVGSHIIWDGTVSPDARLLESALRNCATLCGLVFMELTIACTAFGIRVAAIEPYPAVQSFGQDAQAEIIASVVELLVGTSEIV